MSTVSSAYSGDIKMNNSFSPKLLPILRGTALKRGAIFGSILICALAAFEVFNFSTTAFALHDVLGDLAFAGMRWATMLAFAFCGIDFAGIARIFTPEQGRDEPAEVYYLFGAWLLAAVFNATLTWWGVSVAIVNHRAAGDILVGREVIVKIVPIFVAAMVWLIRVLIIGTFSVAGERLFTLADVHTPYRNKPTYIAPQMQSYAQNSSSGRPSNSYPRPTPKPVYSVPQPVVRPEPTYHPVGMSALRSNKDYSIRR
jgi:hypothetical protein